MSANREWLRDGTTWLVFSLVACVLSLGAFAIREDGWGLVIVQWAFIAVQIFCFVRMVVCFRRELREVDW